jgi:hypothetical protein
MTTSNIRTHPERTTLRLRMGEQPRRGALDGGWWPQSRDLGVELADLIDHFPAPLGRISRVLYSPPDWDTIARRIPVAGGRQVKTGSFPRDDTHVVDLKMSDGRQLRLLVVPSRMSADEGEEALLAATTPGNQYSAPSILATVADSETVDPFDHWNDEGGSFWEPHPVAPSYRTEN